MMMIMNNDVNSYENLNIVFVLYVYLFFLKFSVSHLCVVFKHKVILKL